MDELSEKEFDKLYNMKSKDKLWRTVSGTHSLSGHARRRVGLFLALHFIFYIGLGLIAIGILAMFGATILAEILPIFVEMGSSEKDSLWWIVSSVISLWGCYFILPDWTFDAWHQSISRLEGETLKFGTFWLRDDFVEQSNGGD